MLNPFHDLAWSLHQGKLHELFLKDSLTLPTWGLVIVTLLLVIDSWNKGREQRKRWDREDEQRTQDRAEERARWKRDDEIREEALKPKFEFGLLTGSTETYYQHEVQFWCVNLGFANFMIDGLSVRRFGNSTAEINPIRHFEIKQIVPVGNKIDIPIPNSIFEDVFFRSDEVLWITVGTASSKIESLPRVFSFFAPNKGRIGKVSEGFYELKQVLCEKCGAIGVLDPDGLQSTLRLLDMMRKAENDLSVTCPNHQSQLLRSVIPIDGRTKRLNENA